MTNYIIVISYVVSLKNITREQISLSMLSLIDLRFQNEMELYR